MSSIARRISNTPGRKHSTSPDVSSSRSRLHGIRTRRRPGAYGCRADAGAPGTSTIGQSSRNADTRAAVERRRHDDDPQVVARAPGLLRQARSRRRRGCCVREIRRGRSCGSPRAAGPAGGAPSARLRSRRAAACADRTAARDESASRSPRRSSSRARSQCAARWLCAATRRGCSRISGPSVE